MKTSELISELQKIIEVHGDVEIASHRFYRAGYDIKSVFVKMLPPEAAEHYQWETGKKYCLVGSYD